VVYAESRTANQKPQIVKFCAPFNGITLLSWNPVGISKKREKSGLAEVSTVNIQIKWIGTMGPNSKVFSSVILKN